MLSGDGSSTQRPRSTSWRLVWSAVLFSVPGVLYFVATLADAFFEEILAIHLFARGPMRDIGDRIVSWASLSSVTTPAAGLLVWWVRPRVSKFACRTLLLIVMAAACGTAWFWLTTLAWGLG